MWAMLWFCGSRVFKLGKELFNVSRHRYVDVALFAVPFECTIPILFEGAVSAEGIY